MYTLYVDAFDRPVYEDPALKKFHDNMMKAYQASLGSTWPFFADIGWQLEPYFDAEGLPLTLLVDTATMKIIHVAVGHHSEMLKTKIEEKIGR